jgi:hypothetical protein
MNQYIYTIENINNSSFEGSIFWAALISFIFALIIWQIKNSFEKFKEESNALNELQIALGINMQKIKDNKSLFNGWLDALNKSTLYSTEFHHLFFPYEKVKNIKNSKILNQVLSTFYMCESFGKDLSSMHKSYYDLSVSSNFDKKDSDDWIAFNKVTHAAVIKNKASFETIMKAILRDVDDIKRYIRVRRSSCFFKIENIFNDNSSKKFEKLSNVILVDAINTFVDKENGKFQEIYELLEQYPNKKIILTNADDEEMEQFNLNELPYEVFTLKHNPEKSDPLYFEKMLKYFNLKTNDVIYFEHNKEAVKSAQSIGITTYYYDHVQKDLNQLKSFLNKNI